MSTTGTNIKRLRQDKGLSQDKLSKLADLSLNTVVKIELGENRAMAEKVRVKQ